MREKSLQMNTTVNDFEGTKSNGYNLYRQLIQGMSIVHQTNVSTRASTSATSSAACMSSDSSTMFLFAKI